MSWTSETGAGPGRPHPVVLEGPRVRGVAPTVARPGTRGSPPTRSPPPAWSGPSRSQITSREGGRSGSTTTDELDDSLLSEAVARSEALMAAARPDPEQVEGLGPQDYPDDPRLRRGHRRGRPGPAPRRRQGGARPRPRPRSQRLGLLRDHGDLVGDRQQEGELRLPPIDRRRVLGHDAHRRRHRLGLCRGSAPRGCRTSTRPPSPSARRPRRSPRRRPATCRRATTP